MSEQTLAIVSDEIELPVDLLNREAFVNNLISVCSILSANKKNACYSINGEWGSGKSFVLNMFEEQIKMHQSEKEAYDKYAVFHYNCWQYDYYEEPLIAIVAAMLDAVDEHTRLIPAEKREQFKCVLKTVGSQLFAGASKFVEEKAGINIKKIVDTAKDGLEKGKKTWEESYAFDPFFDFKKTLAELRKAIEELAKEQTILFIVDELDRCLPEYTIRVLERLHHVFDEVPNVQVIIAIDRVQLEYVVKQIYGEQTSVKQYLAKFIDFEVKLVRGEMEGTFRDLYPEYFDCFIDETISAADVDAFYTTIFKDTDMRTCKAIVEKSYLCHKMLNNQEQKMCSTFLCIELFLSLLKHFGLKVQAAKESFDLKKLFADKSLFTNEKRNITGLIVWAQQFTRVVNFSYINQMDEFCYVYCGDINGIILGCYRTILGFTKDSWETAVYGCVPYQKSQDTKDYVRTYWKFLKVIN